MSPLGLLLFHCGAATEGRWHDSGRRVKPLGEEQVKTRPQSGSANGPTKPTSGPAHDPASTATDPNAVGPNAADPSAENPGIADPNPDDPNPDDPSADEPPSGTTPVTPPTSGTAEDDSAIADNEDSEDEPELRPQAICGTTPIWTVGELVSDSESTSPTSWLVPAADSVTLGWSSLLPNPHSTRFLFGTGDEQPSAGTVVVSECASFTPPWPEVVGAHAVSSDVLAQVLACPAEHVSPSGALDGGALALTPDGKHLVRVRCAGDHTELLRIDFDSPDAEPPVFVLSGEACPTRMVLTDEYAVLADNAPALRFISLADGGESFQYALPGIVGQLDTTASGDRLLLSTLRGDLIDLKWGRFDADALVLGVPVSDFGNDPKPSDPTSRLSFVNGGSLVPDPTFAPGAIQLPAALHPAGTLAATFGPDEALVVLDTESRDASVLEAGVVPDELLAEEPRSRGVPTALEFSRDGQFLARVRGSQLAVFACTERPRR